MKPRTLSVVLLAAMLLSAAAAFSQGFAVQQKTSGGPLGTRAVMSSSYYMPKMIRVEATGEGNVMIFRLDKRVVYEIYQDEKSYAVSTFEEWEARMKQMSQKADAQMAALQKQMANMPEAQRKMMEKMMPGMKSGTGASKPEVVNTDESKSIAGLPAKKYVVKDDGKEVMTVWATSAIKGYDAMKKDYEELTKEMTAQNFSGMTNFADAVKQIGGFPMEMTYANAITMSVTKLEQKNIPAAMFDVPAGYKKVPSKMQEEMNKSGE